MCISCSNWIELNWNEILLGWESRVAAQGHASLREVCCILYSTVVYAVAAARASIFSHLLEPGTNCVPMPPHAQSMPRLSFSYSYAYTNARRWSALTSSRSLVLVTLSCWQPGVLMLQATRKSACCLHCTVLYMYSGVYTSVHYICTVSSGGVLELNTLVIHSYVLQLIPSPIWEESAISLQLWFPELRIPQ